MGGLCDPDAGTHGTEAAGISWLVIVIIHVCLHMEPCLSTVTQSSVLESMFSLLPAKLMNNSFSIRALAGFN